MAIATINPFNWICPVNIGTQTLADLFLSKITSLLEKIAKAFARSKPQTVNSPIDIASNQNSKPRIFEAITPQTNFNNHEDTNYLSWRKEFIERALGSEERLENPVLRIMSHFERGKKITKKSFDKVINEKRTILDKNHKKFFFETNTQKEYQKLLEKQRKSDAEDEDYLDDGDQIFPDNFAKYMPYNDDVMGSPVYKNYFPNG